ncbi:MAG TPA: hypothetical protein VJB90_01525 [Candidatus Nanoarchaeia archaeon]|nr:hypothetical protein [Candidatus Nanoarchaeia archaeon]
MSLEDKVKDGESRGFARKAFRLAWKTGMALGTTALSMYTLPLLGASATLGIWVGSAFAAGGGIANLVKGESLFNTVDKALTTYSAVNAVISPMVWLEHATVPLVAKYISDAWWVKGLYASTLYNAAFVSTFRGASHLVDHYLNPIGITKTIGNGFLEEWFKVGLLFSPFYTMSANGLSHLAFQNFYVPKITAQGIVPHYISSFVAPTFAAGALPVGFTLGMLDKAKGYHTPYALPSPAPAH